MTRCVAICGVGLILASCAMAATQAEPATAPPFKSSLAVPREWSASEGVTVEGRARQGELLNGRVSAGAIGLTLDGVVVPLASDGRFIIGFGRDAPSQSVLVATLPDGRSGTIRLDVEARQWPTQTIGSVKRRPLPDAEYERGRAVEVAEMVAARQRPVDSDGWRQRLRWPVTGRVSGVFGSQRIYAGGERDGFHNGVDIARPTGTIVVAPADGVVILATTRPYTLEGYLVIVDHGHALSSTFLHLSRINVATGARIRQGQPIGAVGTTGRSSGPHLHWGMRWKDARIDPQRVAGPMPGE